MTRLVESQNSELTILWKEVKEYKELFETRKKRTKGMRIKLQGEFVFSTEEVLKTVREAELKSVEKRPRGRPRKRPIEEVEEEVEEEEAESNLIDSELELEECVARTTRVEWISRPTTQCGRLHRALRYKTKALICQVHNSLVRSSRSRLERCRGP